jgi:hypothetical protein
MPRDSIAHRFFDRGGTIRVAPFCRANDRRSETARRRRSVDRGASRARQYPRRQTSGTGEIALRGNRQGNCDDPETAGLWRVFRASSPRERGVPSLHKRPLGTSPMIPGARREQHNVSVARRDDMPRALQFGESRMFGEMNVLAMPGMAIWGLVQA